MNVNNNILRKKHEKGFVLALTLFASLILATLIAAFLGMTAIDLNLAKNHTSSSRAYYIAEAGAADAINRIQQNGPLTDASWELPFPSGSPDKYIVAVSQNSTVIKSTGFASASNFSRALEVKIKISGSSQPYKVSINQWKETAQ
jgi:hypothetical protein